MKKRLTNVLSLGVKELRSVRADPVLVLLVLYTFTFAVYAVATGAKLEVEHAAVAIVDEDRSELSGRIKAAIFEPFFKPAREISASEIDQAMDLSRYTFVIEIPPKFESNLLAGRKPSVQINADATAMAQAGNGAVYLQNIVSQEVLTYAQRAEGISKLPINLVVRSKFNPNLASHWFTAVMQVINNITILSVILTGAALIREREHGTVEHLLVMPVTPIDIMLAKIWANAQCCCRIAVESADCRVVGVVHWRRLDLSVLGNGAWHLDRNLHDLDAAVRSPCDADPSRHEPAIGINHADGEHAAMAAERDAALAVDAFREFRPGDPLSRRGPLDRLAAVGGHGDHRVSLLCHLAQALPQGDRGGSVEVRRKLRSKVGFLHDLTFTPHVLPRRSPDESGISRPA
jgi:hypothetical protein